MQELRVVPRVGEEPRRRSTTGDRSEGTRTPNQLPLPASSSRTQRESERRSPPGGGAWEGAGGNSRPAVVSIFIKEVIIRVWTDDSLISGWATSFERSSAN